MFGFRPADFWMTSTTRSMIAVRVARVMLDLTQFSARNRLRLGNRRS